MNKLILPLLLLGIGESVDAMQRVKTQARVFNKIAHILRSRQNNRFINRLGRFTALGLGVVAGNGPSYTESAASADWHDRNDPCSETMSSNSDIRTEIFNESMQEIANDAGAREIFTNDNESSSSSSDSSGSSSSSSESK